MKAIRISVYILSLVLAASVFCACGRGFSGETPESLITTAAPAAMPDDFALHFEIGINPVQMNVINFGADGKITKDLVMNGTAGCAYSCPKEDLEAIYAKMQELSIPYLTGNFVSDSVAVTPNTVFLIRYTMNGREYTVSGDGSTGLMESADAADLELFRVYLVEFMMNTDEYKSLPEAEGGYD